MEKHKLWNLTNLSKHYSTITFILSNLNHAVSSVLKEAIKSTLIPATYFNKKPNPAKWQIPANWQFRTCVISLQNNYNCYNIYWDPLIWLVKNGHLIALTCISFFNESSLYSWGAEPFTTDLSDRTTFVILCNASMKRNWQPATTDTLPYTYTYIFRRKSKD